MNEIERKVDMLISGMKIPKRTSRIATIVTSLLIAMTLIASASLISFYYEQTAENIDIECAITITDPDLAEHDTPWEDTVTLGTIYAGDTYIYPEENKYYTITNNINAQSAVTVYIHVDVTETPLGGSQGPCTEGLTVKVYNNGVIDQITLEPGTSETFTIHIMADQAIDHTSTYGYTITMDWNQPAP